ncbi:hypothetical protein [Nonlabens sp.]|uniref:hypothetical protein n=1 Tax=Nonlabens sp. TaxID=1888209 RepID=UPI00326526FF
MNNLVRILFLLTVVGSVNAQDSLKTNNSRVKKGDFYVYWGWNLSGYSDSDITFKGDGYDFTLDNVQAYDRQSDFDPGKYLNPESITIPQYNFRIGYYVRENYSISLGIDHMKYVVAENQTVNINGFINDTNSLYNGVYNNEAIVLEPTFLTFEHTDGLNYVNVGLRRHDDLFQYRNFELNTLFGLETGVLVPKTNTRLLDKQRYDQFHVSGYGVNAVGGIQLTFLKYFFVQSELKGGYINLPDVRTTMDEADSASQSFWFYQVNMVFGARFKVF